VGLRSRAAGCAAWPAAAYRHAVTWPTRCDAAFRLARVRVGRATAAGRPAAAASWAPAFAWATAWLSRHDCRHTGRTATAATATVRSSAAVWAPTLLRRPAAPFDPTTAIHSAATLLRSATLPANSSSPDT